MKTTDMRPGMTCHMHPMWWPVSSLGKGRVEAKHLVDHHVKVHQRRCSVLDGRVLGGGGRGEGEGRGGEGYAMHGSTHSTADTLKTLVWTRWVCVESYEDYLCINPPWTGVPHQRKFCTQHYVVRTSCGVYYEKFQD